LQRSPHLVARWVGDRVRLRDCLSAREVEAPAAVLAMIARAADPLTRDEIIDTERGIDEALVSRLLEAGVLCPAPQASASEGWNHWSPEAALFHFGTKDHPFDEAPGPGLTIITEQPPAPLKHYRVTPGDASLPTAEASGALAETLRERRTWRRFSNEPVALDDLSRLLGMTWGVQHWAPGLGGERLALKTSPSGGAKHSIAVYVAALRVEGLAPATYHYCPDRHYLSRIADAPEEKLREAFLPGQPSFAAAPAIFFLSSVFARVQSKYRFARAYRVVLLEAGHLAQTFCLLATERRLAPFCTGAWGDSAIENHLGIDGVRESVVYAVGVGRRPGDVDWAPFDDERNPPRLEPPRHRRDSTD